MLNAEMPERLQTLMRKSVFLYALFLLPTVMWFAYGGASDAALSQSVEGAWQATFWHLPGVSGAVSRYMLDGLEWLAVGALLWFFWRAACEFRKSNAESDRSLVLRWTLLCALALLWVVPFHSSDLYGYLNRGFQQSVFHTNPYLTPVAEIPHWQQEPLLHAHWEYNPCPYGFFFAQWVFWLTSLTEGHIIPAFFLLKLTNLLFLLGTVLLIARLARQLGQTRPWFSAFLFGANPLVLLHVMANGHNDILMVFLLLLSLACLDSRRWSLLILPFLALSVLTKYASLLAAPFILIYLLQQRRWRPLLLGGLLSMLLLLLLAVPYVEPDQAWPFAAMLENAEKSQHSIADLLARLVYYPAKWLKLGDAKSLMGQALGWIKAAIWLGFILFYAGQVGLFLRARQTFLSLVSAVTLALLVLIAFVNAKFHPWYVVMFLPLALLLPQGAWSRRFALWFALFQMAGFTLLQNVHILNVVLLTLTPLWLSFRKAPLNDEAER